MVFQAYSYDEDFLGNVDVSDVIEVQDAEEAIYRLGAFRNDIFLMVGGDIVCVLQHIAYEQYHGLFYGVG